jgi:hypothetical protein
VAKGYLGNTGELYDPVSSWARPWAGTDCGNPYLCRVDSHDPMTDEKHIAHLMAGGTHAVEIKHPIEARALLKMIRQHLKQIAPFFRQQSAAERQRVRREVIAVRRLAGERTDDRQLAAVFGNLMPDPPIRAVSSLSSASAPSGRTLLVVGGAVLLGGVALAASLEERNRHARRHF